MSRVCPGTTAGFPWGVRDGGTPLESDPRAGPGEFARQPSGDHASTASGRSARAGVRAGWPMTTFFRGTFQELWLTLSSDEPLGILDTSYLEDWSGQDGRVSLLHLPTGQRFPVPMAPAPSDSRVNFKGWISLSGMPNGAYGIQGRVRDLLGNTTVLGDYHAPDSSERVLRLDFDLADASVVTPVVRLGPALLQGGMRLPASLPFNVTPHREPVCNPALPVSGFPSRPGVPLPASMR